MDNFGIGAQAKGALQVAFTAARGTGRTDAILRSLHDGDLVVFKDHREAKRVKSLAKEMGRDIETVVCDPRRLDVIFHGRGTLQGQLVFDHSWLEEYYLMVMEDAYQSIERLRKDMSGYDERHAKTKMQAMEMAKWQWPTQN